MSHVLGPPSNPFSTRFVRSGALPFRFPGGGSPETVRRPLEAARWWGQIVGEHGSGKTTLLRTLDRSWPTWGRLPVTITLRNQQRKLPVDWEEARLWTTKTQVIVDGYEQLSGPSRFWLWWWCRRSGCGLLVTTHRAVHLPVIYRTRTSKALACRLARELLERDETLRGLASLSDEEVGQAFGHAEGNLRETWFLLYDRCRPLLAAC